MQKIQPPSKAETLAGSTATESALTLISALSGNPLGALLPVLSKSLANERQRKRVEAALMEINEVLEAQGDALRNITDGQYKMINEAILAFLHTTSLEKLVYLRRAVQNSLSMSDLESEEAIVLSRVVRDISAEEADFLLRNFSHKRIQLSSAQGAEMNGVLVVPDGGREELIVSGLISLGLLIPAGPTWDDSGLMRFSNIVAKVIALLR